MNGDVKQPSVNLSFHFIHVLTQLSISNKFEPSSMHLALPIIHSEVLDLTTQAKTTGSEQLQIDSQKSPTVS